MPYYSYLLFPLPQSLKIFLKPTSNKTKTNCRQELVATTFWRFGLSIILLLQSIKAATEESLCGDRVSEELLDAADDLYHLRIPSKWSQLGGDSSPPPTWSLAAWFTDLGNRFSHIDRIIVQVHKSRDAVDKNTRMTP